MLFLLPGGRPRLAQKKRAARKDRPILSRCSATSEVRVGLVADETHRRHVGALGDREHFVDILVARIGVRLQVKLDLPIDDPNAVAPPVDPVKNKIVIEPTGVVLWNGTPVDPVTLRQYLDITTTMTPTPELHLQPHPDARYEDVDEVLAITKRANVTAMGFVGNEAYATF